MSSDFVYFALIYRWLTDKITTFGNDFLSRSMVWATSVALLLVTLWILIQSFRILTGRSRDSMMAMVMDMSRIGVIVAAATVMAVGSVDLQQFFGQGLAKEINHLVTGSDDSPSDSIDKNLAYTQLAMAAIEAVPVPPEDAANSSAQSRASLIAMLGVAGPPMTAGAMLLMFQIGLALFIGLGPLFILCLIFEQTKQFFNRWLMYGLATLFSLAVLNFMTSIVLELTLRVAGALWAANIINGITGTTAEGFTNQALQQGGIGLLLTAILISAPAKAAQFFGGTLGQFQPFTQMTGASSAGRPGPQGQPAGTYAPGPSSTGQATEQRMAAEPKFAAERPSTPPPPDAIKTTSNA